MVRRVDDKGGFYHEPPYTDEEELMLYRATGPFTVMHPTPPVAEKPPQKAQPLSLADSKVRFTWKTTERAARPR